AVAGPARGGTVRGRRLGDLGLRPGALTPGRAVRGDGRPVFISCVSRARIRFTAPAPGNEMKQKRNLPAVGGDRQHTMHASPAPPPPDAGPRAEYRGRQAAFWDELAAVQQRLAWLGNLRFAAFLGGPLLVGLAIAAWGVSPFWLLIPVGVFLFLSARFERAARRARYVRRAIAYYEHGLARLDDAWMGRGVAGAGYLDDNHPYAADLDLFGPGSLFERLCDARTRVGRDRLAQWLSAPAPPEEVRARQAAVAELRDRLAWRERVNLLGADVPEGIDTGGLVAWGRESGGV